MSSAIEVPGARPASSLELKLVTFEEGLERPRYDRVATEEPMEIRLRSAAGQKTVAITMRTPGNDFELAAGFLFAEGVIADMESVRGISYCVDSGIEEAQQYNIVNVDLSGPLPELASLERHFATTSACGVCGKANLESLRARGLKPLQLGMRVGWETIVALPERLRSGQGVFERTGGLHAAALFDATGALIALREDVGRHNAVDKLVGSLLLQGTSAPSESILMVSGRSSFEIVQKALAARIPVLCAVSAPSSLAVALATEFGMTLVGFLRGARFNVYSHAARIGDANAG